MANKVKYRPIIRNDMYQKYLENEDYKLILNPVQPAFIKGQMERGNQVLLIPEFQKAMMEVYMPNALNVQAGMPAEMKKVDEKALDIKNELLALGFEEKEPFVFTTLSLDILMKVFDEKKAVSALNLPYLFIAGDKSYRVQALR